MNADEGRNGKAEGEHKKRKTGAKITKSFLCAFCVVFVFLVVPTVYATDYSDVSVKIESVTEAHSSSGYDEYRATIINRSPAKSHRVTVEMYGGSYTGIVGAIRRTVEVAPSAAVTVSLFYPQSSAGSGWLVTIDGTRQEEVAPIDTSRTSAWISHSQNTYYLIVSRNVEKSGLMSDAAVVEGFKSASGEDEVAYLAYKSPMKEWSANWLGYSGFDAVIVTAEELREAPEGVRSALWRYVECGGLLLVIGMLEIPKQWQSRRVGIIEAEDESDETKKIALSLSKEAQSYAVGFGQVIMIEADGVKRIIPAQWEAIKLGWKGSRPTGKNYYDIADINREFSVVDRIGIPVRGLFVLMLAFVVVIGPINLIWLARRRKKIWMLWTVPAIALVTCLAVAGFALLGEGVSATSRVEALTILDESSHRATTIGWMAFYSPITPGEGLHFGYDTELIPAMPESWKYRGGGYGDRRIDFSNNQHLDAGWITARVPVYFRFRKNETRRERLTVRQAGPTEKDSISLVNGLGADIQKLWFADRGGKIHGVTDVSAGAQANLKLMNLQAAGEGVGLREIFGADDWLAKMALAEQNPERYLTPGAYLAVIEASPFVEEGLKDVRTRKARTLVYGISAEAER